MSGLRKGVSYNADGSIKYCTFCSIAKGENETRVIKEVGDLMIFESKGNAARGHFLVCPKNHVWSCISLQENERGADMAKRMLEEGKRFMEEKFPGEEKQRKYVFHKPPRNSIDHLHLHCFQLPHTSVFWRLAYWTGAPWVIEANTFISSLLQGERPLTISNALRSKLRHDIFSK
uniref:HIT domain-containing protein n=1 Tax=Palpitomonas bilix TaxID=652834 RepID=A0A7S3DDR5_9EUKA|mmetsp:Transcript_32637/g.84279  ORF Transcript_32637/g.84279 Transcript_32637/m.84279 type:complete len:175 (+) Transcript_32637:239-763(+)